MLAENARPRRLSPAAKALLEKVVADYLNNIGDVPPSIRGEVYIAIVNQAERGKEIRSIPALAASILNRRKISESRRSQREQLVPTELLDQFVDDDGDDERELLLQRIREASTALSARAQNVIELRLQGCSLRESAAALGITYAAAQRCCHRALKQLKDAIRVPM